MLVLASSLWWFGGPATCWNWTPYPTCLPKFGVCQGLSAEQKSRPSLIWPHKLLYCQQTLRTDPQSVENWPWVIFQRGHFLMLYRAPTSWVFYVISLPEAPRRPNTSLQLVRTNINYRVLGTSINAIFLSNDHSLYAPVTPDECRA